jgi:hypothetical protein
MEGTLKAGLIIRWLWCRSDRIAIVLPPGDETCVEDLSRGGTG